MKVDLDNGRVILSRTNLMNLLDMLDEGKEAWAGKIMPHGGFFVVQAEENDVHYAHRKASE